MVDGPGGAGLGLPIFGASALKAGAESNSPRASMRARRGVDIVRSPEAGLFLIAQRASTATPIRRMPRLFDEGWIEVPS